MVNWRQSVSSENLIYPRTAGRICLFAFSAAAYFALPWFVIDWPQDADNHYVKTLREVELRRGSHVEFDRVHYVPDNDGDALITFTGEKIGIKGLKLKRSATVSIRGNFMDNHTVQVSEFHIHSDWFRDGASYTGLTIVAMVWAVSLIRKKETTFSRAQSV